MNNYWGCRLAGPLTLRTEPMFVLVSGIFVLAAVYGLFVVKEHSDRIWLARFAYSEFIARMTLLGMALTVIGILLLMDELLTLAGVGRASGFAVS
jgi:hypothetical protein